MAEKDNNAQGQKPKTSLCAVAALVLSVGGLLLLLLLLIARSALSHSDFVDILFNTDKFVSFALMILGLILGVWALVNIKRSGGQLVGSGYAKGAIIVAAIVLVPIGSLGIAEALGLFPQRQLHPRVVCAVNLKGCGIAMMLYASDYDGKYPTPDSWCDLIIECNYTSEESYKCPAKRQERCSYSMNKNVIRNNIPPDVVLLFESKPGWNQVGGPELLNTENHEGEGCNILFGDISVHFVKTKELGNLKWKVEEKVK